MWRGDILLVAVGDAKHLVDLEDRASLEAVAEGVGYSARNVQVPLLGDEDLELLAAPVGDGEPTLGGEPADSAGIQLFCQDYLDDGTGDEDDEVIHRQIDDTPTGRSVSHNYAEGAADGHLSFVYW